MLEEKLNHFNSHFQSKPSVYVIRRWGGWDVD